MHTHLHVYVWDLPRAVHPQTAAEELHMGGLSLVIGKPSIASEQLHMGTEQEPHKALAKVRLKLYAYICIYIYVYCLL